MRYDRCLVDTFLIGDELSSSLRLEAAELDLPLASGISNAGKAPELHDASLPQAGISFIGRSAELTELHDLLHDPHSRLLTLVGPGGIGKTRLALELARQLQDKSVTYMDLQQVDDPILVPTAMAMALKLKPSSTPNALEILRNALSDSAHVILLDNFEQVLDAGNVLTTLLEACPKAKFVVTSRKRLAQPSEVLYPVDGLHFAEEASDAVKLFNSRARQANARFRPSPGNLTFILEICRLVESSPLAIELAAAWLRSVPVEQIAAELQRGPELLEEGVGKGRRSLRAIFEESYKRLNEKERELLSSVSVFRGGFTRADALQMRTRPCEPFWDSPTRRCFV